MAVRLLWICLWFSLIGSVSSAQPSAQGRALLEAPNLAASIARQFDVVVSINVSKLATDALTDEELDGLGFSPQELGTRPGTTPNQPISASGLASGFIISSDGYIITNAHVVADTAVAAVRLHDARQFTARVVGLDKRSDVALLKIDAAGLPVATIGDSTVLAAGEWVIAVGSPLGLADTATAGIVSMPRRVLPGTSGIPLIQSDVAVNPGSSGGPLFNQRGEVVGVNTLIYSTTGGFMGISLSIPIDVAMRVATELRTTGRVRRGELGALIQELTHELALSFGLSHAGGALVTRVQPRSAADRAGLRSGDIVLGLDERFDTPYLQLQEQVSGAMAGTPLRLNLWRAGAVQRVAIVVGEARSDLPAKPVSSRTRLPRLGLQLGELSEQRRRALNVDGGLTVIRARGAAARAGVLPYDIIVAVGQRQVRSLSDLDDALASSTPKNRPVALLVMRDGRFSYLAVSLFD